MASLAGKADPTLARMAYAAGMANVPGDYSKHYKTIADEYKELMGNIGEKFEAYKLDKKLSAAELEEAMGVFTNILNAQTIDANYTQLQNKVTAQREEWKANKGYKDDQKVVKIGIGKTHK